LNLTFDILASRFAFKRVNVYHYCKAGVMAAGEFDSNGESPLFAAVKGGHVEFEGAAEMMHRWGAVQVGSSWAHSLKASGLNPLETIKWKSGFIICFFKYNLRRYASGVPRARAHARGEERGGDDPAAVGGGARARRGGALARGKEVVSFQSSTSFASSQLALALSHATTQATTLIPPSYIK
jgi:hypothetical protein